MSSYKVNLGEINPSLNYNECTSVSFKVKFKKAHNFTKYAVILELLADMNDGEKPIKIAKVSKIFDVKDFSKSTRAIVDWDVHFNNVVIGLPPFYNSDIDFEVRVIGINVIRKL